ncbi:MAG: hypothetical protein ABIM89_16440 [Mycobacteriales bacterium]
MRRRGVAWVGVVAVALLSLAACGASRPSTRPGQGGVVGTTAVSPWQPMATSPLSPRDRPLAITVAGRVLFFGGRDTDPCPPNASCVAPTRPALRDVAAYDPATDRWTSLSPAPQPMGGSDNRTAAAVVGGTVYFLSSRQLDSPSSGLPTVSHSFFAYDVLADRWSMLRAPADSKNYFGGLAALGERVAAYVGSHESYGASSSPAQSPLPPDMLFNPTSATWSDLPADPLRPSFDRQFHSTGTSLVLLGSRLVAQPGNQPPSTQAAILEPAPAGGFAWRELPVGDNLGVYGFHVAGYIFVNIGEDSANGGEVNNWGRRVYEASEFDVPTAKWSQLPRRPKSKLGHRTVDTTVGGVRYAALGNWLYDVLGRSWTRLPRPPDAAAEVTPFGYEARTPAWVDGPRGGTLVIWGGVTWQGKSAQDGVARLRNDGWRVDVIAPSR